MRWQNSSRSSYENWGGKNVFRNTIKQIPPESYKEIQFKNSKIDYDQSNNIDIIEVKYDSDYNISFWFKKQQNSKFT